MMLKNTDWKDVLTSKTWWGTSLTGACEILKQVYPQNAKVILVVQVVTGIVGLLGLVDRTAAPKAAPAP